MLYVLFEGRYIFLRMRRDLYTYYSTHADLESSRGGNVRKRALPNP